MKKFYFSCIFLLFSFNSLLAQKEARHWFFGGFSGLDFSSGIPVADTNGSLFTLEGCATISGADGNLLFYTNGVTVWNRNHLIMPTGTPLFGDPSSSQSAIIVPKPGDVNIYYIFTIDWAGSNKGLNYYTVDMTLNGGLGDVLGVNNVPTATNILESPTTEKITAVQVFDEDNFWVITLKSGRFYVFKVDANGINTVPVLGNSGFVGWRDARGYLKVSPDGTKLASANMTKGAFIYDFNSATGVISNERELNVSDRFSYGIEFSPNGKKLYISTGDALFNIEKLYQFKLDIPNPTAVNLNTTRVELHSYFNSRSALQLGPDGKIYRAMNERNSLGVINNPDEDGAASNYQHGVVDLGDKISKQGLPQFIQSFFSALIQARDLCLGDVTNFSIRSNEPILSIVWDFGDGSQTSTQLNPSHTYTLAGDYTIVVEVTTEDGIEIVTQTITISNLPSVTTPVTLQQCDDDIDGISIFNLREAEVLLTNDNSVSVYTYHLSQANADANTAVITNPSVFSNATASQLFVRVENEFRCYRIAELNLQVSTTAIPSNFILPFRECDTDAVDNDDTNGVTRFDFSSATQDILALFPPNQNLSVSYYENTADALAEENALDPSNYRNENSPFSQQIVVRVDSQNNNACLGLGFHISLRVDPLPEFTVTDPQYICLNQLPNRVTLQAEDPEGNYTYEWRDSAGVLLSSSSTASEFTAITLGDYFVTAITTNNCTREKKITVVNSNIATVETVTIVDDSDNNTITIEVSGVGDYEFSLDDVNGSYQDQNHFENVFAGIHTVYIRDKNGCGLVSEDVSVIGFPRFFTPNGDGFNDTWQVLGVGFQPTSKILIFDRFGKILARLDASSAGWDGTYRGKQMPSSDYWFRVELEDRILRRGHFSLIRR